MKPGSDPPDGGPTRRTLVVVAAATTATFGTSPALAQPGASPINPPEVPPVTDPVSLPVTLRVNGRDYGLSLDPRVTLLDALRERLHLTGSKKGCDQGQCGACTVLIDGRRINACLTLAVMHGGDEVTTIEGLGAPDRLHPMQAAFIERDGFQCGYCTPGQILSAAAVLEEIRAGVPSHATPDLDAPVAFSDEEVRERMSGNICRCAAYPNIVAAIRDVHGAQG